MKNGVILPIIASLWKYVYEKWNTSLIASIFSAIGDFINRSLPNSFIISSLLSFNKGVYSGSLISKFLNSFLVLTKKPLHFLNKLMNKPIANSFTYNVSSQILNIINTNLFQLICLTLGTGILTYTAAGFALGRIGIKKAMVLILASLVLGFLGLIKVDTEKMLSESKFATLFRNFFDYYC